MFLTELETLVPNYKTLPVLGKAVQSKTCELRAVEIQGDLPVDKSAVAAAKLRRRKGSQGGVSHQDLRTQESDV